MSLANDLDRARQTRTAIEDLIARPELLGPELQPLTRASDGQTVGHKATGRGNAGSEVADTLSLLAGARSLGLVERLDWAFRCHTFDVALDTPDIGELHLTPEPETFGSACPPRLADSWNRGRRNLDVVAELHDDAFADLASLERACEEMRSWGWRFAVADLGGDPRVGAALEWIQPAYIEVDVARLVPARRQEVADWTEGGRALGAKVLAVNAARNTPTATLAAITADLVRFVPN
jgi:EAL domain-containing protein (putative c-di-GMP-specific phosphodiesterase class I)